MQDINPAVNTETELNYLLVDNPELEPTTNTNKLQPDYSAIVEFLRLLDPYRSSFFIHTYPDDKNDTQGEVVSIDIDDNTLPKRLHKKNSDGWGLHLRVQRGGCKREEIEEIVAFFVDLDEEPKTSDPKGIPTPNFIVESKRGKHLYWLLEKNACSVSQYSRYQSLLAEAYGADPNGAHLITLRLPGSIHWKDRKNPKLLEGHIRRSKRYTLDDFPQIAQTRKDYQKNKKPLAEFGSKLKKAKPGERNSTGNEVGFSVGICLGMGQMLKNPTIEEAIVYLQDIMREIGADEEADLKTIEKSVNEGYKTGKERAEKEEKNTDVAGVSRTSAPLRGLMQANEFYGDELAKLPIAYNRMTQRHEYEGETIAKLDDLVIDLTTTTYNVTKGTMFDLIEYYSKKNSFDPRLEYLNSLPKTKEITCADRLSTLLFKTDDARYDELVKFYLMGAVARVYHPGSDAQFCLVLQGEQNIGKDTFYKYLFKDLVSKYRHEASPNDILRSASMGWVCLIPEIETLTGSKATAHIKQLLSDGEDSYRKPYERDIESIPRSFVFGANANSSTFLNDPTGARRFLTIPVNLESGNYIDNIWVRDNVDTVWAEAKYLYGEYRKTNQLDDVSVTLPKDLVDWLNDSNECFSIQTSTEEVLEDAFRSSPPPTALRNKDIAVLMNNFPVTSSNREINRAIANVLEKLKYKKKKCPVKLIGGQSIRSVCWYNPRKTSSPHCDEKLTLDWVNAYTAIQSHKNEMR